MSSDHITYSPITPVNKNYKKRYLNSISKSNYDFEVFSPLEKKSNSSSTSSTRSTIFSPLYSNYDSIENASPTPVNYQSNKRYKKSPQNGTSINNSSKKNSNSNHTNNLNKNSNTNSNANNNSNNLLSASPYKVSSSVKRRRSSIGICMSASPTPYRRNSSSFICSPTYSIKKGSVVTSSTKKKSIYSPRIKNSPKRLFHSPGSKFHSPPVHKFKTIRSPKIPNYGKKDWNLNCSPNMQRIKRRVRAVYGDRFIPNREFMDMASSQLNLSRKNFKENMLTSQTGLINYSNVLYQESLAQALSVNYDQRILAFNAEAPSNEKPPLRTTWKRSLKSIASIAKRRIPTQAERVLDAPGIGDDFYSHLLDWSCNNIVAIALDSKIYLWNASTGDINVICEDSSKVGSDVCSISWTQDGKYLGIGTSEGDTQIWDVEQDRKLRSMYGHVARVGVLSWDKYILSSGCRDGSIYHHDVRIEKHKTQELLGHCAEVCGLAWKSDGQLLASGGNDNLVNIWDVRSTLPRMTKANHNAAVKALAWCPWQSNLLATGGGTSDRTIHFWNTTTETKINSICTGSQVTSLIWSLDYKEILSSHGFPDNNITLWKYPTLDRIMNIQAHDSRILFTSLSPDGQTVATAAGDENLKFWKLWKKKPKGSSSTVDSSDKENDKKASTSNENDSLMSTFYNKDSIR